MAKLKLSLDNARELAAELLETLQPSCYRIQIAGSIRRRVPYVGDVELVAIPRWEPRRDLFGEEVERINLLDYTLAGLIDQKRLLPGDKMGPKYKKLILPRYELQLDLFVTDPIKWGLIYTIRTGSADFSHWLVTPRAKGGALPAGLRVGGGHLWSGPNKIPTPEEQDFFMAIGLPWIEPPQRKKGRWGTYSPPPPAFDETATDPIPF